MYKENNIQFLGNDKYYYLLKDKETKGNTVNLNKITRETTENDNG